MKFEVKNKENQRLSMQNEQLQFRLQSQSNLSLPNNETDLLNLSNISNLNENSFFVKLQENENANEYLENYTSLGVPNTKRPALDHQAHSFDNTETPVVKLRSKSFKNQLAQKYSYDSRTANEKKYSNSFHNTNNRHFRPVSEAFNFEMNGHEFSEQNYEMTRSEYDDNETQNTTCSLTDACESNEKYSNSNSSSTSLLDSQSTEDPMTKSVPCMVLKDGGSSSSSSSSSDKMTSSGNSNYSNKDFLADENCEKFISSSSSSIEHSVAIVE